MLIEDILPIYDFREYHAETIRGTATEVYT